MLSAVWDDVKETWKRPFSADMDAAHWFLFIGLMLVFLIGWRIVLNHILED